MYRRATRAAGPEHGPAPWHQRRDVLMMASTLVLLTALAAAAFGQGAFFATVQWLVTALIAVALALAASARAFRGMPGWFALAGLLLAIWAVLRAAVAGTPASGLTWVLFGAGTAAVLALASRLDPALRRILLGGVLAIGSVVAATGWLGVALHQQPWGLPSQHLWRGAATLTYANATAALLVPLALVALARLTATPGSPYLPLIATGLLTGAGATLSRAGAAAFVAGLLVVCWLLGTRTTIRAAAGPVTGAGIALLGLVPSLPATAPARPLVAAAALVAGLGTAILMRRAPRRTLVLPAVGAALVAALILIYRAPEVHTAVRMLMSARFNLASSARSGEAAAAIHLIEHHPLAGMGPGHATLRWTAPGGGVGVDRFSHDEYLQVLTDLGVIGAVLAAIFMIATGRLLRWAGQAGQDPPQRALWAGAIAAIAAFLLHSGFDFLWQVPAIPLTVGALAGLAIPSAISQRNTPAGSDSPTKGPTEICDVTYPSRPFWPESQSPVGPP